MGCTESQSLNSPPNIESLPSFTIPPPPKLSLYEDKILLESEFTALRKNVTEAIHQTEVMKTQIDLYQSSIHPAEFESMKSKADYVMDWMELDLRDGDQLMEVLVKVYPACREEVQELLAESFRLRNQEASIKDYLPYFQQRYELLNRCWADIVSVWGDCNSHASSLKADLAAKISALEDFLGKKSDQLEDLKTEMRRLTQLNMHTFLTEQRHLSKQIAFYSSQAALKKQREVEAEKDRCVHLLQAELVQITHKYQHEVATSEARMLEFETNLKGNLERKHEAILEEGKEREKRLNYRLEMQGEDLASRSMRFHEEQTALAQKYKSALEDQAKEINHIKQATKQEKGTLSMQVTKELNQLKKDRDLRVKELQENAEKYKEEIERQTKAFEQDRLALEEKQIEELRVKDEEIEEIRKELNRQKADFEEKLAALTQESILKVTDLKGFEQGFPVNLDLEIADVTKEQQDRELQSYTIAELEVKLQTMQTEHDLLQSRNHKLHEEIDILKGEYGEKLQKVKEEAKVAEETVLALKRQQVQAEESMEAVLQRERTLEAQLSSSGAQVKSLEMQLQSLGLKSQESIKAVNEEAAQLRSKLQLEAAKHKKTTDAKDSELKEINRVYDSSKRQLALLSSETLQKDTLIADLELQKANNHKRITDLEAQTESLIIQLQEAKLAEESLRRGLKPSPTQDSTLKRYLEALSQRDAKIKELVELQQTKEAQYRFETQRIRMKSAFSMLSGHIGNRKRLAFAFWRYSEFPAFAGNLGANDHISGSYRQDIEWVFAQMRKELIEECPLAPIYQSVSENQACLSPLQTFRLLEHVLEQKYEADFGPFRTDHPQSLPEFAISLLTKASQQEESAYRTLSQGLISLISLMQEGHPYANLLCRAFNIASVEPYPVEVGLVLEQANAEFERLAGQFEEQFHREEGIYAGGRAFLVHVITLVYELFKTDMASGELILRRLKPDTVSLASFVSFNVCYCLARTGLSAEDLFFSLDPTHSGLIEVNELITGLRSRVQLWLREEDLSEAFTSIVQGRDAINQSVFLACFDYKQYLQLAVTEAFSVTKCNLLRAIGDVYFIREREIALELLISLHSQVDRTEFSELVRVLDSDISSARIAALWRLAERGGSGQTTRRSALKALLSCKIGRFSRFAYYDERLDRTIQRERE